MDPIYVSPLKDTLINATGRPDEAVLKEKIARAHATIKSLLGDKNEIWLGKPRIIIVNTLRLSSGKTLLFDNTGIDQTSDLFIAYFACSFRPAPECEFVSATVRVRLSSGDIARPAIAYDIFPRSVELPISYKRKLSLSPNVKISFEKVAQVEASAFETEVSDEYLKYEPEITAFGVGESEPGWDFNKTKHRPIRGIKDLFVLISKPNPSSLNISFEVSGWVQTDIGEIPLSTFFLSGSDRPLAAEKFQII